MGSELLMITCKLSKKYLGGFVHMKEGIHPKYNKIVAKCACGNEVELGSVDKEMKVEICSACHPFFTGKQKLIDSAGRVEKFMKKYAKHLKKKEEESA